MLFHSSCLHAKFCFYLTLIYASIGDQLDGRSTYKRNFQKYIKTSFFYVFNAIIKIYYKILRISNQIILPQSNFPQST